MFMLAACLQLFMHAQRQSVDLSGSWEFAVDAKGALSATSNLDDVILLPGSMPQRLKGNMPSVNTRWTGSLYDSSYFHNPYMARYRSEENLKLPFFLTPDRHYVGDAWYRRVVQVPASYAGKRVVLYLERPHITSTLFINTREVGSQNSLSVAHVYDVTDYVKPGESATICIKINNDADKVGVGQDSHSVTDQTQGNWNGIVGRMELRAIPATHIAQVDVFPNSETNRVRVSLTLVRSHVADSVASIRLKCMQGGKVLEPEGKERERSVVLSADTTRYDYEVCYPNIQPWDEFNPRLCDLDVELLQGKNVVDKQHTTFGLRNIETWKQYILVNNRPTMMRGTVENCCFPLTGYPPTDKESWLNVFRKCKEYGLNHMRFHSYCPPEAAFEAADELGFYLQPEGPSWPNHGVKLGNGMMIDKYLMQETERMVQAYGNHPSFAMLASGNEPAGNWVSWVSRFVDYWRAKDNRRIYTGASVGGGWAWQPKNQYHVKAGARGLDWDKREPNTMDDFRAKTDTVMEPFISHETGQWCAFPDFKETSLYTGVNKARNFEIFADILRDKGMAGMAEKFLMASGKLQTVCYKYEIEKTLRTPYYAGYQLLGLNDYSGQGTALVGPLNVFWKEKGYVKPEEWKKFCAPVTLQARLPRFTYFGDEEIPYIIEVANYGEGPIEGGNLTVSIHYTGGTPSIDEYRCREIPHGNSIRLANYKVPPFLVRGQKKVTLKAELRGFVKGKEIRVKNTWDLWVYSRCAQDSCSVEQIPGLKDLYVCKGAPDEQAKRVLDNGGRVLIMAGNDVTYGRGIAQQFTPVFWNTSWFKMRPPHTTGMYIEKEHPLFKYFPTDDFSDIQWWPLMNKQTVMLMDNMPKDFMPIVQPIDTWFLSRKLGMLFEAKVGRGKVLVTTLSLDNLKNPSVQQMYYSIMKYVGGDAFNPRQTLDWERITELFKLETPAVNMFTKDSPDELKKNVK